MSSQERRDRGSRSITSIRHKEHLSHALTWAGVSLYGFFLYNALIENLPPDPFNPRWQLQEIGTILSLAYMPLIGSLLIYLASEINTADNILYQRVRLMRRLCTWVAIGFLLFIPLQISAGANLLNLQKAADTATLNQWKAFRQKLQLVTTERELRSLLATLKEPVSLPDKLNEPVEKIKSDIISSLDSRILKAANDAEAARRNSGSTLTKDLVRSSIYSFLWAMGFGSLAQPLGKGRGSLLHQLLTALKVRKPIF